MGEVYIIWLGAPPTDYRTNTALKLIGNYLTQSATAPLQKEFIEIPKPFTTAIGIYSDDKVNQNELQMAMFDVPAKHLNDIADMIRAKLANIVKEEGIDMERMGLIMRRDKRKLLNIMETSVSSVLSDAVIGGESDLPEEPIADDQTFCTVIKMARSYQPHSKIFKTMPRLKSTRRRIG